MVNKDVYIKLFAVFSSTRSEFLGEILRLYD